MGFPSRPEYEVLVYGIFDAYPEVISSTNATANLPLVSASKRQIYPR